MDSEQNWELEDIQPGSDPGIEKGDPGYPVLNYQAHTFATLFPSGQTKKNFCFWSSGRVFKKG